ncbi:MAG: TetR/AcrR family transcriptional regulator [Anaerolineales bacterium]|nr:TetR/AcrR family transcriptional regulator [Anaerolineales bacterium]MBX3035938.1 TetR/AcrR family transcriptional regulator [Anaerolineales bacterium]
MKSKTYHHGDLKNALIKAGVEILAKEGIGKLSLRKVALKAGVSHTAPYSHFSDKQSLIAAISTEGFQRLSKALDSAIKSHANNPKKQLIEGAQAYVKFALANKDIFKIMFSSALEKEKDYPAFVEVSQKAFIQVIDIVRTCQEANIIKSGEADVLAVIIWGQVHGIIALAIEGQISHTVLEKKSLQEIVTQAIEQAIKS